MITVSSITKNTGRYAMILPHFLYSCKLCFQFTTLCYYSYMHQTVKKESKKEILKRGKNKITKNLLQGDSNADPLSTGPSQETD